MRVAGNWVIPLEKSVRMLTLVLLLSLFSWPMIVALVVSILCLAPLCHRLGVRRSVAAAGLLDVTLLPVFGFWSILSLLSSEGTHAPHAFHRSFDAMMPYFSGLIVVYALSVGGTIELLRRKSLPEGMLPVRGIWAQHLCAALCLVGFAYVVIGDAWPMFYASTTPAAERFWALLMALAVTAYFVPLWDVLARGWRPPSLFPLPSIARNLTH